MAKHAIATTFLVAPTDYGWSVDAGGERLGLFVTQRQALDDVKKRRVRLTASGDLAHHLAAEIVAVGQIVGRGRSPTPIRLGATYDPAVGR